MNGTETRKPLRQNSRCKPTIMKKIFTLIVLFMAAFAANAQNAVRIAGAVKDNEGKPAAAVTVSLLRAKDSSLAKLAVSDKNGQYEFVNIKEGKYLVAYSSVGFTKTYSKVFDASSNVDLPAVSLATSSTDMKTVTVVSRKPIVEMKMDKMVVNVDASPTNAGNTAMDVLEKSPGITVDKDGIISMKGKQGVIVMVDGKPTYLGGQDLANYLKNLPANQLDQIELMTQPSAKYDAAGNSGVINLRTKKSTAKGFNGSVNLSYIQAVYPKSPNSFNFNYRQGKVNIFSSLSYSYWQGFNDLGITRKFHDGLHNVDTTFTQTSNIRFKSNNYSARLGLDYTIDKKTSVGFMVNGTYNPRENTNYTATNITDENNHITGINEATTKAKQDWKNFGANVNFRKTLKKQGQELGFDADYVMYSSTTDQTLDNYSYNSAKQPLGDPYLLRGVLPQDIKIYSAKVDYAQPVGKSAKLETGAKSSYVKTDNNAPYESYNAATGTWAPDVRADHFAYEENINAAYANYSGEAKKWSYQMGLRMEHTHSIGNSIKLASKVARDYVQLFPSAFLSYKHNDNNTFGLSYSRRLERPNYEDMNPFQRILDKYTYQQGNPYLTPEFTHNIEFSHNYKSALNTVVNYTYTTDIINDLLKQNDATKQTFQTKENIATRRSIGLAVSYNAAVTSWWTTSVFTNVYNNYFKGIVNNKPLDVSITSFMGNMSQQFRFAKTWNAEINGFYRTQTQEGGLIVAEPMGVISFGFGKQIFKSKGTIKLSLNDPFYIQKFHGHTKFDNINADITSKWDNRRVGLSFSYRFSKGQAAQQKKRATSAQDEQNRAGGGGGQQ